MCVLPFRLNAGTEHVVVGALTQTIRRYQVIEKSDTHTHTFQYCGDGDGDGNGGGDCDRGGDGDGDGAGVGRQ